MNKQLAKHLLLLIILFSGCTTDLLTKNWASRELQSKGHMTFIENYLDFTYTENRGMVFGFFNDKGREIVFPLLLAMNILASLVLFVYIRKKRDSTFSHLLPFYMIQAGAIGNIVDKFRYGYVVDFIHIHIKTWLDWPYLFNIADVLLCVGIGLLMIESIQRKNRKQIQ